MITTYIIPQKRSNTGTINDIESDLWERRVKFFKNDQYAVVLAAYYGGKGYTTHRTALAAAQCAKRLAKYSLTVIDREGREYHANHDELIAK